MDFGKLPSCSLVKIVYKLSMRYSLSLIKILQSVEPHIREALIAILEEIERHREESVTKTEFNELKKIVQELAEAQKRTEQRVNELAEAQRQTETEIKELREIVGELAKAQKRTKEELRKLIKEHQKTRENLGGLQHTVGYILEDRAYKGLPPLLERDFGIKLLEPLRREYIKITPGNYIEVNIIGYGQKNGKKVWIVGECKSQLKKRHISDFLKDVDKLKKVISEEMILIAVTYQTPPSIQEYVKEKGIKLYFSYEFPLF